MVAEGYLNNVVPNPLALLLIKIEKRINREDVMKIFAQHGITGNPILTLETETQERDSQPLIDNSMSFLSASTIITPPPHGIPE